MIIDEFRRFVRGIERRVWLALLGIGLVVLVLVSIPSPSGGVDPASFQATLNAAATQQSVPYPTLRAVLTLTPVDAIVTHVGPTLALEGLTEVRQYAASATADNSRGTLDYSAVQAAGPPNTLTCGDARTAWASLNPTGPATLTLLYAQLVIPTQITVYQSFNPGYIRYVNVRDAAGKIHTVYSANAAPGGPCPGILTIDIPNADYGANTVLLLLDQTGSAGGWNEIDAVQLVGTKYN